MKKLHAMILTLCMLSSVVLSGCWNFKEVEHLRYPVSIGFDYRNKQFEIYLQLINFTVIAKVESGGSRQKQEIVVVKGVGKSFDEAAFNIYSYAQQRFNWSHIRSVVIGKGALRYGMNYFLDNLGRYSEYRHTWWVFTTERPIPEILLLFPAMNTPAIYSQLGDPMTIYRQSSYIQPLMMNRFETDYFSKSKTTLLPRLSHVSSMVYRTTENRPILRRDGVCMLANRKFVGCLDVAHTSGLRWLNKHTVRTSLRLFKGKQPLADLIMEDPKPKISYRVKNGKAYFTIKVKVTGSISNINISTSLKDMNKLASQKIESEIRNTFKNGVKLKTDIYSLSDTIYRKDVQLWKKLQKDEQLPLKADSLEKIEVDAKIVNSGEMEFIPS
ncbi:MAG: Ger(x)C family spore germination protein [Clostridia bacterium]